MKKNMEVLLESRVLGGFFDVFLGSNSHLDSVEIEQLWGPRSIAKLVHITPISLWFMIYL